MSEERRLIEEAARLGWRHGLNGNPYRGNELLPPFQNAYARWYASGANYRVREFNGVPPEQQTLQWLEGAD